MTRRLATVLIAAVIAPFTIAGCGKGDTPGVMDRILDRTPQPDVLPAMLNAEPPFSYPPQIYARKLQGNVNLRLYIDKDGSVVSDSTRVVESSGIPELDSLALVGAAELRFSPATRRGEPMGVSIMYPVYYRHPEADPLPGDAELRRSKGGKEER